MPPTTWSWRPWLAYLKSRLLLPVNEAGEPAPEHMSEALQFHLRRLEAMRRSAEALMRRPRLGKDMFRCGNAQGLPVEVDHVWRATLYQLVDAYAGHMRRTGARSWRPARLDIFTMDDSVRRLEALIGAGLPDWKDMFALLPAEVRDGIVYRSAVSSTLAASLELARQGRIEVRQSNAFGPIELRARPKGRDS